jgi:hypothetical protein
VIAEEDAMRLRLFARSAALCSTLLIVGGSLSLLSTEPAVAAAPSVPAQVGATNWTATAVPSPAPTAEQEDIAVSCVTSTFCVAAGSVDVAAVSSTHIDQWNGAAWSAVNSPNTAGVTDSEFESVSCTSTSFCMAVGFQNPGSVYGPLTEEWNGSVWSIVPTAALAVGSSSELDAISCTSTTFCVATGLVDTPTTDTSLIEQWNGASWSLMTHPDPTGMSEVDLDGVSCNGSTFCMAVGLQRASLRQTLAEMWNGTVWTVVTMPAVTASTENYLTAVSCAGPGFCATVGTTNTSGEATAVSLIEHWNGASWSVMPSPNPSGSFGGNLTGVSCISATSCTTVGGFNTNSGLSHQATSGAIWNGVSWSEVTTPDPAGVNNVEFDGVSCLTNSACHAVGNQFLGTNSGPFNAMASIARGGYRFVASDGGIFAEGASAPFLGSLGANVLNEPIVGMAVMPAGDGYYLVASDGGVFAFGSAQFYGSTGSIHLNKPIVGMAVTADGAGYWLVASDGGIFAFGDAQFYGSTGALALNKPIVGMAATPNGLGYYLVASDGGIFAFGNAAFEGSTGALTLNKPIVGMGETSSGGYYLVASDGGIFTFPSPGGPPFLGSTGALKLNKPIVGMAVVSNGYYLGASDGGIFTFPTTPGGPPFLGSQGGTPLNKPIVGIAS